MPSLHVFAFKILGESKTVLPTGDALQQHAHLLQAILVYVAVRERGLIVFTPEPLVQGHPLYGHAMQSGKMQQVRRLSMQVCLFGANEVSLRDAMREGASDADLRAIISAAVQRKRAAHAGMFELARTKNRAMIRIGG